MERAILNRVMIPGLVYRPGYLPIPDQNQLLAHIDQQSWLTDLKRRVQHYGYRYDYQARTINAAASIGPLPDWLAELAIRLRNDGWIGEIPDQAIINEYQPGQGIARHIDCIPCFGDTIISLTLGSPCVMTFTSLQTEQEIPVLLEPGSLVVMRGESRYEWKHGIAARKTDVFEGQSIHRGRRVSVTFRQVFLS